MITFVQEAWHTTLLLAPWLLLGAFSAGLVHKVLPPGWMQRHFQGASGVLKAVTLGVPMPLCSCGVIPAGLSIKKQGGSSGASMAFMISTPQTGIDSVLVAASFLGWPLALFKVALAAVTGIVGGLLGDDRSQAAATSTPSSSASTATSNPTWKDAYLHAQELIETIWGWLVFGILFSATLSTLFPAGAIGGHAADSLLVSSLLTLVIALPLYVCATASVPIAAALVHAGMPLGSALIFLMAGPATNAATIGAVHRTFGKRRTIIYLASIIIGSVGGAFLFEAIWGNSTTMRMDAMHQHGFSLVEYSTAIVLLGYFVLFAFRDGVSFLKAKKINDEPSSTQQTIVLPVEGMTCQGCVKKLTRNLEALPQITSVHVDLESASATVSGSVSEELICETVTASGFRVA